MADRSMESGKSGPETAERASEQAPQTTGAEASAAPFGLGLLPPGIPRGLLQRKLARRRAESAARTASASAPGGDDGGATGGLQPGASTEPEAPEELGGIGDALSDVGDVVGSALGNAVGGVAAALTGVSVSTTDTIAAKWEPQGRFTWDIGWATTGKSGWIVQQIVNTIHAEDDKGKAVATPGVVPSYYEAWAVSATSAVSPSAGATNDMWRRPARGANTKGHWSMRGHVYFTATDPAKHGLTKGGVSNAGILLSSTAAPPDLGVARQQRYAHGTWDATGGKNTHTGSAA